MDLREVTGYVAHVLIAAYWLWVVVSTAPQMRKGTRDRGLRLRIAMLRTAVLVVLFLAVGVIHFWGTEWWHIAGAALGAGVLIVLLRRAYRRLVAPAQHRLTLRRRALGRAVQVPPPGLARSAPTPNGTGTGGVRPGRSADTVQQRIPCRPASSSRSGRERTPWAGG